MTGLKRLERASEHLAQLHGFIDQGFDLGPGNKPQLDQESQPTTGFSHFLRGDTQLMGKVPSALGIAGFVIIGC